MFSLSLQRRFDRDERVSFPYACIGIGSTDRRAEKYLKKLLGNTDIEDALKRLDKLTQEEVCMATAQLLKITHGVDGKVKDVMSSSDINLNPGHVFTPDSGLTGNQWRQDLRKWFSSPDPSTNHIIQCGAQHQGTANWFFRGSLFEEWESTGSLLWIHGKREPSFTHTG